MAAGNWELPKPLVELRTNLRIIRFEANFYNIFEGSVAVESNFDYFIEFRIIRSNFLIIYKTFILMFLIYNFPFFFPS
jgi:hypothetical protein